MEFLNQAPIISEADTKSLIITFQGKSMKSIAETLHDRIKTWDLGDLDYYVGSFYREDLIKELAQIFHTEDPRVEKDDFKNDFDKLAFFLVKTDQAGHYVKNSFQLSPMLWALKQVASANGDVNGLLDLKKYQSEVKKWDEKFQEIESELVARGIENDTAYQSLKREEPDIAPDSSQTGLKVFQKHLQELYGTLYHEYRISSWPDKPEPADIVLNCVSYQKNGKKKETQSVELPMISQSFFVDDLKMLFTALSENNDWLDTAMGETLLNYINDPNLDENDIGKRIDVNARSSMSNEDELACKQFFATILNARYAPIGRWPTQYPPALMQQVAINMVSQMEEENKNPYFHINGPIFSVNGPPGTGKTTLLKEIIVNNIVRRAQLLAQYEEADKAFECRKFKYGTAIDGNGAAFSDHRYSRFVPGYYIFKDDKVNNYGMLVTSCNNKAVENITTDIPVDEEVSSFIQEKRKESPFLSLDMEDFYFTNYVQKLLNNSKAWGLIAAPLGKGDNLNKFFKNVADPMLINELKKENMDSHRQLYKDVRNLFLEQCRKVEAMQKELAEAGELALAQLQKSCGKPLPGNPFAPAVTAANVPATNTPPAKSGGILNSIKRFATRTSRSRQPMTRSFSITNPTVSMTQEAIFDSAKAKNEQLLATEKETYGDQEKTFTEKYIPFDLSFLSDLFSKDNETVTRKHTSDPGFTHDYDQERKKLFLLALLLHKEFILSSNSVKYNLQNFKMLKKGVLPFPEKGKKPFANKDTEYREDYDAAMRPVLQTLFLLTPVISTTFASVQRFLDGVAAKTIGLLIVDESGQASPHMALGALLRSRATIIVGDPKQVEPVVTDELDLLKKSFEKDLLYVPYLKKTNSVQTFADKLNHFGTYLKEPGDEGIGTWVGSPLVVHRRCISPMYDISNELSYNGIMKKASITPSDKKKALFWQPQSLWLDIKGKEAGAQNHFVPEQAEYIFRILQKSFQNYAEERKEPDIFVISPFKTVANGMKNYISKRQKELPSKEIKLSEWMNTHIGTVHTFQGQGAHEVIFFPGCCDSTKDGTIQFVNANIVNVAVTRAKSRLYVVGDWDTWKKNKNLKVMQNIMSNMADTTEICRSSEICQSKIDPAAPTIEISHAPENGISKENIDSVKLVASEKAPLNQEHISPKVPISTTGKISSLAIPEIQPVFSVIAEHKKATLPDTTASVTGQTALPPECPKCRISMERHIPQKAPSNVYWKCPHCGYYKYEHPKNNSKMPQEEEKKAEYNCPFCRNGVLQEKTGKYGLYWNCPSCQKNYPNNNGKPKLPLCFHCGTGTLVRHMGKYRHYWKCENPHCGYMFGDKNNKPDLNEAYPPIKGNKN